MKIYHLRLIGLLSIAATAAQAGTHVGIGLSFGVPAPIIVHRAPPAPVVERVIAAPGPGYVWLPGHYSWQGQWIWIRGAWVMPPRSDSRWVDGAWNPQSQQWMEGHWEIPTMPASVPPAPVVVAQPAPEVATAGDIVVAEPPPAPVVEVRSVSPGPDFTWIDGYWGWERGHRVWYRGHWENPPHGHRMWVAPRWDRGPHGYVFVRGYWR